MLPMQNFSVRRHDVSQSRHLYIFNGSYSRLPPQTVDMYGYIWEGLRVIRIVKPGQNFPLERGGIGQSWDVQRISELPVGEPYATSLIFRRSRPIAAVQLYQQRTVIRSETKPPAGQGALAGIYNTFWQPPWNDTGALILFLEVISKLHTCSITGFYKESLRSMLFKLWTRIKSASTYEGAWITWSKRGWSGRCFFPGIYCSSSC